MIHPTQLARLRNSQMRGEAVATIFESMAFGADKLGCPSAHLTLDYQHPDDVLENGQLIPVITLSLRTHQEQHEVQQGSE